MSLLNEIKTTLDKEGIAGTKEYQDSYETGINVFNWRNRQFDPMSPTKYSGPISAGTLNTFIGRSGAGKTSAVVKIATNIAEQFEESNVIHFDFEHSSNIARVRALSGWDEKKFNEKYLFLNSGITSESFYQTCRAVAKIKIDKRKELEYDTGVKDSDGKPIMELPPTIIIVDSIAAMYSDDNAEEEEMGGTMSATQQARTNNQVIKRLTGASVLSDGNLIILAINHVTSKIQINAFQQTSSDINYLAADESLPGGTSFVYLSNSLIRLTGRQKLDPTAKSNAQNKYNVKGFLNEFEIIKSRTAPAGVKFEVIFDQTEGFLNSVTDIQHLIDAGIITGRGTYEVPGYDKKFRLKQAKELYDSDEEFRNIIDKLANEYYETLVSTSRNMERTESGEEPVIKELDSGMTLQLVEDDEDGGIWVELDGDENSYFDSEGNSIEIEFE